MFNVGGGELIVILLIALIVLGPQRLPDAARQIGKTMGEIRRLSTGFQNEMRSAINTADDPTRLAARRNVLAKEEPAAGAGADHPVRTEPLVAGPGLEPRLTADPVTPPKARPPSAQARAAAKKAQKDQATAKKAAPAKNGTPVKNAAKPVSAKKASTTKAAPPRAKP